MGGLYVAFRISTNQGAAGVSSILLILSLLGNCWVEPLESQAPL